MIPYITKPTRVFFIAQLFRSELHSPSLTWNLKMMVLNERNQLWLLAPFSGSMLNFGRVDGKKLPLVLCGIGYGLVINPIYPIVRENLRPKSTWLGCGGNNGVKELTPIIIIRLFPPEESPLVRPFIEFLSPFRLKWVNYHPANESISHREGKWTSGKWTSSSIKCRGRRNVWKC